MSVVRVQALAESLMTYFLLEIYQLTLVSLILFDRRHRVCYQAQDAVQPLLAHVSVHVRLQ